MDDMSGGNANITVAIPGRPNWGVWWEFGLPNFQLDIVGFLAVLGEGSVTANAQVSALSRLFYLPRLLPAPQALLRTTRPTTLPPVPAKVSGVYSGNVKDHIHHVAHVLLGHEMPTFDVRLVEVTKVPRFTRTTRIDTFFRGQPRPKTQTPTMGPPLIKAKAKGPLSWVTLLGFMLSLILFISSVMFGDGMSIVATLLLSGLSTLIGISNKWSLRLPQRKKGGRTVPGDVVIRYPNGSYLIVRCEEDIARELYFAPEEIDYHLKNETLYRLFSLLGTLMLMIGVIALANSKLFLQFAWAGAYIIINAAHWVAAALPHRLHWDLTCYQVQEQSVDGGPKNTNFTEALWKAILLTKSTSWIEGNEAAPNTPVWKKWLEVAEAKAQECKSHYGPLIDPLWPGDEREPGEERKPTVVWDVPDPEDWSAKGVWDKLNEEHMAKLSDEHMTKRSATVGPNKTA